MNRIVVNFLFRVIPVVVLLVIGCSQEESFKTTYPVVRILNNVEVTDSSSFFRAEIYDYNPKQIDEYGFEWKKIGATAVDRVIKSSLNEKVFSAIVKRGLEKEVGYSVRAYVKVDDYFIFSDWISFTASGSLGPRIDSISPLNATWNDTLNIFGRYFSFNHEELKINLGDVKATILSATDTLIKVAVPTDFVCNCSSNVRIELTSRTSVSEQTFSLLPTELISISPSEGGSTTFVSLYGRNFYPLLDKITIDNIQVSVDSISTQKITFKVPATVSPGLVDIKLTSGPFPILAKRIFKRNGPEILEVIPNMGYYGDTVTIKGNNFGTGFDDLLVFVNGFSDVDSSTTISSWAMSKIVEIGTGFAKIIIPKTEGYYYKFRVTADYVTTVSDVNFFIEEPQITSISPKINLIPGQLVKIEGDRLNPGDYPFDHRSSVILGGAKSYAKSASPSLINYVVPFAKTNDSFLKMSFFGKEVSSTVEASTPFRAISTIPGESRSLATGFSIGKNAFVLTGYAGSAELNNEVWMLNSQTYTWIRRGDFPSGKRHHATSFSLNGMGYLLGGNGPNGQTILSSRPYNDLWEYNPVNDSWIRKKDIPFHAVSAIQVGNEIYAAADQSFYFEPGTGRIWGHGGGRSLWKYIPTSDEWLRLPDYGGDFFFTTRNDLYTIIDRGSLYEIFRFDVNSTSWISVNFIQISLNGQKAYFVLNETTALILANKKFYKFSSLTNDLTLLTTVDERIWTGDMSTKFEIEGKTFFSLFGNGPIQDLNNIPNLHNSFIEFSPNLFNIN